MVSQACHQAEDSTPYSLSALQAVHKLNRCLMEVPNYDQAVLFAERAASLGPLPDSLLRLLCSGAPAAMLLASNCLHHLCASTQVARQCGEAGLVETVLGLLKGGGRGLEPALVDSLLQLLVTSTQTDVRQRVTLGSLRGVVTLLATLLGGIEFVQSRVTALELLKVVLLSRKGSRRQMTLYLF
ncbi:MAG: hypothetical protein WDW38_000825 [Sanguina aurantia]